MNSVQHSYLSNSFMRTDDLMLDGVFCHDEADTEYSNSHQDSDTSNEDCLPSVFTDVGCTSSSPSSSSSFSSSSSLGLSSSPSPPSPFSPPAHDFDDIICSGSNCSNSVIDDKINFSSNSTNNSNDNNNSTTSNINKSLNTATNRKSKTIYISNEYPVDFNNILPTVFKYPIFNGTPVNNTSNNNSSTDKDSSNIDHFASERDKCIRNGSNMMEHDNNSNSNSTGYGTDSASDCSSDNNSCLSSDEESPDDSSVVKLSSILSRYSAQPFDNGNNNNNRPSVSAIDDIQNDNDNSNSSTISSGSSNANSCTMEDDSPDNGTTLNSPMEVSSEQHSIVNMNDVPMNESSSVPSPPPASCSPQSLRFPLNKNHYNSSGHSCHWCDCSERFSTTSKLLEHLQNKHVNPQTFKESFVCLWKGCKVYNRPSCSRMWLERHVVKHGGNRPFRCIIEGCGGQRFSSLFLLERHISRHFKKSETSVSSESTLPTVPKLIRRNGQKLRYRRQPFSVHARTDLFDVGIMLQLQYLLLEMMKNCQRVNLNIMNNRTFLHINFHPKVIGCRVEVDHQVKYLVRWHPFNILDDEWLPQTEVTDKSVPLWKLPYKIQEPFWKAVFPHKRPKPSHQSRKYKFTPATITTTAATTAAGISDDNTSATEQQ